VNGVRLTPSGHDFFTWDPVLRRSPSRPWRRWGTDRLLRLVLRVLREHRAAHPEAPRLGVGDISRRFGGDFSERYGGLGHVSHQNGLDVDIYYPRHDRVERRPARVAQVDRTLAQDLIDRFVAAGVQYVFVGRALRFRGPRKRVVPWPSHDDHLHVRIHNRRRPTTGGAPFRLAD
jgi:murein endopeptidase